MRIAIITQNFLPEMGALTNRMYPFAQELAAAGHEVFVVTGMPNYPRGVVFPAYKGKLFSKERFDNYTVLRAAYYPVARNKSKWSQAVSYLSFLPGAFWNGLRAGKLDIVLVTSPPLFVSLPALLLAWLRGARLICDIRDLWPDEIVACGAATERSLSVRLVRALERVIYTRADRICCTTRSFINTVIERGADPEKTVYLPNGADLSLFRPLPADNPVVARFQMQNRFVVMYCGALGMKHGLLAVLEAAKLVEGEKDILFAFVGAGASESDLRSHAEQMHLRNVVFLGEQKVTDVPPLIARSDVCISCLAPSAYFDKIISVKLFEYLACGKPVIGLHSGETARILNESGAGIVVTPGDSSALAEAIRALYRDSERRTRLGSRGRGYVEQHFSRRAIAMRLNALMDESPASVMQEAA
jgi:putative colanic acid biosynthesis glycosyltransferase WcaI